MTGRIAPWARAHLLPWVRLPSTWIEDGGLQAFDWVAKEGGNRTAALMLLAVIAHHADRITGKAQLTWDELCAKSHLSRSKVSTGLMILADKGIIERAPEGRSTFRLNNFGGENRWAMIPARDMYSGGSITAFRAFNLRLRAELDALKIYFLLATRRDNATNQTLLSYEKIELYSGVGRGFIRPALSLLASHSLVHTTNKPSTVDPYGISNVYRLVHLEPRRHPGTIGRNLEFEDGDGLGPSR